MGVVDAVVGGPLEGRVLDRRRAEEHVEGAQGPVSLVARVREEAVVSAGDREAAEGEPQEAQTDRPPREVDRSHVDDGEHRHEVGSSDEKDVGPVQFPGRGLLFFRLVTSRPVKRQRH